MTLEEFEHAKATHPCLACGALGVVTEREPQTNGLFVRCPHCGAKKAAAWPQVAGNYLKQNTKKSRKARPMGKGLYEVWDRYGNRCCVCSTSQADLILAKIALHSHHVQPYASHGDEGAIVPMCEWCHADATVRQRTMRRLVARLNELYGKSVSDGGAGLSTPRLSPDSLRPEGEAPLGGMEELSDDDAND